MRRMRDYVLSISVGALGGLFACGGGGELECNNVPVLPETNGDAMFEFGSCSGYVDWPAESTKNPTGAPHGEETRVFINPTLDDSFRAGNTEHPEGSASYKEIYRGGALGGWAAMIKVEAGAGANSWYWFEVLNTEVGTAPFAAATGASSCTGCHEAGADYVMTNYPLR